MRKPIVMDANFEARDPMGIFGGSSPLTERSSTTERAAPSDSATDRVSRAHETRESQRPERMAQPDAPRAAAAVPEPTANQPRTPEATAPTPAPERPAQPEQVQAVQPASNPAAYARDRLMKVHNMPPHVAAAIAGHGQAESQFDLGAVGDEGTSIGGWQWRNERAAALKEFARKAGTDWRDLDTQVDFLVHELNTTEGRAAQALAASRDVDEATAAFMHFERPRGYTPDNPSAGHNFEGRLEYARALAQAPSGPAQSAGNRAIERAIGIGNGSATAMVQPGAIALEDSAIADRVAQGDLEARASMRERGQGGNADGIGLARLAAPEPEAEQPSQDPAFRGALNFVNPGQEKIKPEFASILEDTSAALGQPFTINSGYRSPSHPVEARKRKPGQHAQGTAVDISMRGMNEGQRQQLVRELQSRGVRRFGTYTNSPDMLHVDMADQSGNNTAWFMHDRSNRNMGRAPSWFRGLAGDMHQKPVGNRAVARRSQPNTKPIVMDESFKPVDPMGIFGNVQASATPQNAPRPQDRPDYSVRLPLAPGEFVDNGDGTISTARTETMRDADGRWVNVPTLWKGEDGIVDLSGNEPALRRAIRDADEFGDRPLPRYASLRKAELAAETHSAAGGGLAGLDPAPDYTDEQITQRINGEDPTAERGIIDRGDGTLEMDEADYADWRRQWEAEQPGMVEDLTRLYGGSLVAGIGHMVGGLGATYVANGRFAAEYVLNPIFGTDITFRNPTRGTADSITDSGEGIKEGVSYATQTAIEESTPDGDLLSPSTWTLGENPSLEGYTALTLDVLGSFTPVLIAGLFGPGAAVVAGGAQGGGAAEDEAGEIIETMHRNGVLEKESAYYREQISSGATPQEALERTKIAAGQVAHLIVTPISGIGGYATQRIMDPASKVVAGRGLLTRIVGRAALGAAEEGIQEAAEGVGTRVGTNLGAGTDVDLTEGTFGDFVLGALGGAVPGGVAGAASRREGAPEPAAPIEDQSQPDAVAPQTTPLRPVVETAPEKPKGSMRRAIDAAQRKAEDRALGADPTRPRPRSTVQVTGPDGNPFMATVESIEGDEVIVFDSSSGEILQVPAENVSAEIAPPPGEAAMRPAPIVETPRPGESVPATQDPTGTEHDGVELADPNDPALEPSLPTPTETRTELPPTSETERAIDRPQGRPRPGARVIVDAPGIPRFSGRITRYEGDETVVVDEAGKAYQVPNDALTVSKLTRDQAEAQELKRNPPVERERSSGPTIRDVRGKQIEMPDATHAKIFDLGRMRQESKKLLGASQLDLDGTSPAEQARLAAELGVTPAALGQIADDYRYRVERAAKSARSGLPQKVQPVNPKMLERFRKEAAGAQTSLDIEAGIHEAATSPNNALPEPTDAQKEAGNYKVGRIRLGGLDISIENPAGSTRSGKDSAGNAWSNEMKSHYGYFRGTVGRDKDHIDTFIKPGTVELADDAPVFVVDQVDPDTGSFDEHKVMVGFANAEEASAAYAANYAADWQGMGNMTETTLGGLKEWFKGGKTTEPFADRAAATATPAPSPDAAATATESVTPAEETQSAAEPDAPRSRAERIRDAAGSLIRFSGQRASFVALVQAGADNAALMDGWTRHVGRHQQGGTVGDMIAEATKHGLKLQYPDADGGMVKTSVRGKELAESIRAAIEADGVTTIPARADVVQTENRDTAPTKPEPRPAPEAKKDAPAATPSQRPRRTYDPIEIGPDTIDGVQHLNRLRQWVNDLSDADYRTLEAQLGESSQYGFPQMAGSAAPVEENVNKILDMWQGVLAESNAPAARPETEDDVLKRMGERHSVKGFLEMLVTKPRAQVAAVIDRKGRIWEITGSSDLDVNPNAGAHGHLFAEINAASIFPDWPVDKNLPYVHITRYGTQIGLGAGELTAAQAATSKALMSAAEREGVAVITTEGFPELIASRETDLSTEAAKTETAKPETSTADRFAGNKLFTADKVEAARARLKAKLSQLNSGIDPEILIDGMTIAGAYIEAGVRDFSQYASQMTGDFGESIKPYLLSFWEAARNYPGVDNAGMTSAEDSARLHADLNKILPASEASALGAEMKKPKKRTPKRGRPEDRTLTDDWGVDHIDGYGTDPSREEGNDVKDAFLKEATQYLQAVAGVLTGEGFTPPSDARGKPMKAVRKNEGGPAVSGEVWFSMEDSESGKTVEAIVSGGSLRGTVPSTKSGVSVMFRANTERQGGGTAYGINRWAPVTLTAGELAAMMLTEARGRTTADMVARPAKENADGGSQELDQAGTRPLAGAPADPVSRTGEGRQARGSARDGGEADLFGDRRAGEQRDGSRNGVAGDAGEVSPAAARDAAGGRAEPVQPGNERNRDAARAGREPALEPGSVDASQSAATPAQDRPADIGFTITDADAIGSGGQKTKFKNNVAAIRVLRTLEAENRPATAAEQRTLAKWVGWGGLPQAFYKSGETATKGWEKEAAELKELLTDDEYAAARASTQNAHYTSPEIVKALWSIAERLGFKGGRVLEPSVGAGNFLGLMPASARKASQITGVELDHITGGIARNLYPAANIQAPKGFQDVAMPDGYFDLAIGNPPFGSTAIYDGDRRHLNRMSIHNYFFAKSLDTLKPNGVLAMVVTNYFLDSTRSKAKDYIASKADLVAAIRLPNDAFLENAGTEVTTDIIILRKRAEEEGPGDTRWTEVGTMKDREGREVNLSRYFLDNPDMMLGEFGAFGTMYRGESSALISREGQDTAALLEAAIAKLPSDIMAPPSEIRAETITVPKEASEALVGSAFLDGDGNLWTRLDDSLGQPQAERVELSGKGAERVAGMVRIRDAFARLRRAQIDENATDAKIENLRALLNKAYDGFVKKHGPVNQAANKNLFRDDPTWPQVSALENDFDKGISAAVAKSTGETARAPSAKKAPIFFERTQQPYRRPNAAKSAKDALAQTLADLGRVDLPAMAKLYGKSEDAIVDELGSLIYRDPAGHWDTAEGYLSGNVRKKLAEAKRAAAEDPAFRRNVAALEDVQPADIEAVDIDVKAGAPWVPANHIADFVDHITGAKGGKAVYFASLARWEITATRADDAAQAQWGTTRATVGAVLDAALNDRALTISNKMSDGSRVVDVEATEAANEKVARVKDEWRRWLWDSDTRRAELTRLYNDTFNTDVVRVFDGSHLTLPGKVGDDIIDLRPHQKSFVWRSMQTGTVLADHTVGAGKTFAAIAAVMEKRRIGQWRKPIMVVPNHLVGQWAADFVKLYPGARILAAGKKDFEKNNRKRFFARMATGDWDAIIVAHSSFGRIGVDKATEEAFINEQTRELDDAIDALRRETGKDSRSIKQVEAQRDRLKERLKALYDQDNKDEGMTFDEIGIDGIFVDEAHEFKNLGFATSLTRVAGLGNPQGSQKAADLHMKIRVVKQRTGGQNIMFLTGTPISNTMAEMFTVQRYLDEEALKSMGISHFDAWARVFGEVVNDWELSPAGKYQMKSRFSRFANIPELMQRYRSFADVITNDDIQRQLAERGKTLPIPKIKGGKPQNIVVKRSSDQALFIGEPNEKGEYPQGSLVWRAENLPKKAEKGADNMLKVMSDARKAALDMRLIDPSYGDNPGSKVHQAADRMKALYDKWNAQRGTQLVFIDLSTPKAQKGKEAEKIRALIAKAESGDEAAQEALDKMSPDELDVLNGGDFSVYDDLRQKLIDRGIPAEEIAFIHDANTDLQKEELFGKVRSGRVRFLFGSTPKMGAGTNVQNRLVGLHHLDAPWRPSDLEQREGRIIRQGNELYAADPEGFEVEINRYATELTLDSRMWQTIEQKARFIGQIRAGSTGERVIEDIGGEAANAAEMKAAASGNPLILEEMDLRQKLRKLDGQSREHDREQHRIVDRLRSLGEERDRLQKRLPAMQKESNLAFETMNKPVVTIDGKEFEKPKEAGEELVRRLATMLDDGVTDIPDLGRFGGFALSATHNFDRNVTLVARGEFEHEIEIGDLREQDALGLAIKLRNMIRNLVDAPVTAESRLEDIGPLMERLEKQRGDFPQAEELFQTRQRHQAVLDQLKPKKQETPKPEGEETADGDPIVGWDTANTGPEGRRAPTAADIDQVQTIIRQVAGLQEAQLVDTIPLPDGAPGWGSTAPSTAGGMYQAARDVITIAMDSLSDHVAFHEAFHRLQSLFLTDAEKKILTAERGKLKRMVRANEFRRAQVDGMSQREIEAEAFAIYATGRAAIKPHKTLAAAWDRIKRTIDRARNYLAGRGFQTVEDIFDAARAGRIADRQAGNVQTMRLPADFMTRPVLRLTGHELGVAFSGAQDMPALRRAARAWYDANLRGTTATTADGMVVHFNTVGAKKTVSGSKGDILLRAVPAIRSIIENGRIVHREPGNREHIRERIIIAAPVEFDGTVHPLAVSIHETTDGTFQYDFTFDRDGNVDYTVDARPEVEPGGPGPKTPLPSLEVPLQRADGSINIGFWPAEGNKPAGSRIDYNVNPPVKALDPIAKTESRLVQEIKGKLTDIQPSALALVPLNYFTELKQPNMTAVDEYLGMKRALDAYRGKQHAKSDEVAQKWLKFVRAGVTDKGKAKAAELASIMHDATLAGVDPSKTDADSVNHPSYDALRARFMKLAPAGRALFTEVRDTYRRQQLELDTIILDNIRKATEIAQKRADEQMENEIRKIERATRLTPKEKKDAIDDAKRANKEARTKAQWSMKARLTRLRQAFEASRVPAPYFPLGRFGNYYVVAKDVDGSVISFSKRETAAERDRLANQLRKEMPNAEVIAGRMEEMTSAREAMDPRLIAEVEKIVGGLGIDASSMAGVLDQIWQRYLETMPDLSIRKRYIHRKGVAGFDEDALRVFSSHMFHAAHQMGRLKYGMELQELVNDIARQGREADDSTKGVTLANEMRKRHDWVMNPKGSRVAQTANSLAFIWYLGLTPAAALVNMTQTPIMGIPVLAGRFGSFTKAAAALAKASKDSVVGFGLPSKANLKDDEHQAIAAFYSSGLIDRTQSHDLAGVGDTGVDYGPLKARAMEVISFMFHRAEVWNREVTALAAYRMARAAGQDWTQAVNTAHDLTWKTHFDYSNSSRPRVMQNDFAKVALVFRAHSINMLYRLARDAHQSFQGATPQLRREARRQLAGVFGMMSVAAGVTGVPAYSLAMMLLGFIFGDDDDPIDFEKRFEQSMIETLGPELGGVVLNGVPGHLTGTDLTARIGMPDLWFRSPNRDLEGKEQFEYYLFNSLGANASLAGSWVRGLQLIGEGDYKRGLESIAPKFVRDMLRTVRYGREGLTNFNDEEIIPADDFAVMDLVHQAVGLTPARVSEAWERSSTLKNAEARIYKRRQRLIAQYALARSLGDKDGMREVTEAIKAFNKVPVHRATRITPETLRRSLKARASARQRRMDGVYFRNEQMGRDLMKEMPERVY